MTLKKAYRTMLITSILMMLAIIFYALDVTRMNLKWGYSGFAFATLLSITSIVLSINTMKHERDVKKSGFIHNHRFEILDWFSFLSLSLMIIFALFSFVLLPSDVEQNSMYPTLQPKDRILIYHFNYEPTRNDVVVIRITKEDYPLVLNSMFNEYDGQGNLIKIHTTIYFVKRIMAIPGDEVSFQAIHDQYRILVNGEIIFTPEGEQYLIKHNQKIVMEKDLDQGTLKPGLYMTFGDNPNGFTYTDPDTQQQTEVPGSFDSRSFGAVKYDDIIGKVIFKIWPFGGVR